jgi:hypothetical protein
VLNSNEVPGEAETENRPAVRALRIEFVLPKGAYATTVLANAFDVLDGSREGKPVTAEDPSVDTDGGIEAEGALE